MVALASRLGLTKHFIVNPLGFAGGLLLFWKPDLIDLHVVSYNSQAIHTLVNHRLGNCFITFAYVRPNPFAKCCFWEYCKGLANATQSPWMVLGDLNDIATSDEQWGSSSLNYSSLQNFVDTYSACGLLDPGSSGPKFTWCRFAGDRVIQRRRLDRVLWNMRAQLIFPEAKVAVLPRLCSDHNPILFVEEAGRPPDRSLRPVRFEAAWLSNDDYKSDRLQDLEKQLLQELNSVLIQEETFWFQKARTDWIRNGDRNTTFYHKSALIKRNRNRVRFLKIQGSWTDESASLTDHINSFFSSLFCRVDQTQQAQRQPVPTALQIPGDQASNLLRRVPIDEVRRAVFGMKKYGSPGPDGIPAIFYQQCWSEIGPVMTKMVNQAFDNGCIPNSLLQAYMTLIPKKDTPETAADFRPITLLNVSFQSDLQSPC
ncbi:uncharacterized protein LOC116001285 [Ipomoea triloba]|uniref:uncharacterized protein LOC116001285 n=1 Tax=Ipomoea triloba TaxID=35885 RepID=UPI00125E4D7A|nr:uncharacterized protein LOC116001285 [Ipomoea triloba]